MGGLPCISSTSRGRRFLASASRPCQAPQSRRRRSSIAPRRVPRASTPRSTPPARPSTRPRAPSTIGCSNSSTAAPSSRPGLAASYDVSDDGLEYTFHLRPGVKFQTTDFFTPTRDFNADDVVFSFERQLDARQSVEPVRRRRGLGISRRHGLPGPDQVDREGRRHDREVRAEPSRGALPRRPRHGFRLDHVEGIRRQACRPTARWSS